ncbi:MAG: hypothetical protein ACRDOL_44620, partial [Streptosporangiaceae bacterium]
HGAASSLSAVYLDDSDAGETATTARWARRLGADLREIPPAEAAGALRAGVDAFLRHGPVPWSNRQSGDFKSSCGLAGLAGQRAEALAAADPRSRAEQSGSTQTAADRWPAQAQERLVADFLASPEGQELASPVARSLPRDLAAPSRRCPALLAFDLPLCRTPARCIPCRWSRVAGRLRVRFCDGTVWDHD